MTTASNAAQATEISTASFSQQLGDYVHHVGWIDFGCFAGILCLVAGMALMNLRKANLVPIRDPRLAESLHFLNH